MTKKISRAGQALLDDVLAIKAGAPAKKWSRKQLLAVAVRKETQKNRPAL